MSIWKFLVLETIFILITLFTFGAAQRVKVRERTLEVNYSSGSTFGIFRESAHKEVNKKREMGSKQERNRKRAAKLARIERQKKAIVERQRQIRRENIIERYPDGLLDKPLSQEEYEGMTTTLLQERVCDINFLLGKRKATIFLNDVIEMMYEEDTSQLGIYGFLGVDYHTTEGRKLITESVLSNMLNQRYGDDSLNNRPINSDSSSNTISTREDLQPTQQEGGGPVSWAKNNPVAAWCLYEMAKECTDDKEKKERITNAAAGAILSNTANGGNKGIFGGILTGVAATQLSDSKSSTKIKDSVYGAAVERKGDDVFNAIKKGDSIIDAILKPSRKR